MKASVVIVIINHKEVLDNYETISVQQCIKVLGSYPIWMVVPEHLSTRQIEQAFPEIKLLRVKKEYLENYRAFNRFKINPFLYSYFSAFEYLLYYEPDAFVFENKLDYWCSQGYDFVGAPWLIVQENKVHFTGVGNGGLSLRKVASHLRVLSTYQRMSTTRESLKWYSQFNTKGKIAFLPKFLGRIAGTTWNTHWSFNRYDGNEDEFWSSMSTVFDWFKIPDHSTAMKFSFEEHPEMLYKMNARQLPFGTHAWYKEGRLDFWREMVEQNGYRIK